MILSMAITPLILIAADRLLRAPRAALDGVETADGLRGQVLVIGFGRFGKIALQMPLARRAQVSVIENNPDRIRETARFGFKVYYGDGTRLDILHAGRVPPSTCPPRSRSAPRSVRSAGDLEVSERYRRGKAKAIAHVADGVLQKARSGDIVDLLP